MPDPILEQLINAVREQGGGPEEIKQAIERYNTKKANDPQQDAGTGSEEPASSGEQGASDGEEPSSALELSKEEKQQAAEMARMLRVEPSIVTGVITNKKNKNSQAIANALGIDLEVAQDFVNDKIDYKALSGKVVETQDKKKEEKANNKYYTGNRGHITEEEYNDYSFGFSESGRIENLEEVYGSDDPNEGFTFEAMAPGVAAIKVRNKKNGKYKVFTSGFGRTLDMDWTRGAGDIENFQEIIDFIESSDAEGEDEGWAKRKEAGAKAGNDALATTKVTIIPKGTQGVQGFTSSGMRGSFFQSAFDQTDGTGGYIGSFGQGNEMNVRIEEAQRTATPGELNEVVDFTKQTIRQEIRKLFNSQAGTRLEISDEEKDKLYEDVFKKINREDNEFGFLISRSQFDALMGDGRPFLENEINAMSTVFKIERSQNIKDNTEVDVDFRNESHQSMLDDLPRDLERNKVELVQEARPLENKRKNLQAMIDSGYSLGDNPKPLSKRAIADMKKELAEVNKSLAVIDRRITENAAESFLGIGEEELASRLFEGGDSEDASISEERAKAVAAAYKDAEVNKESEIAAIMQNNPGMTQREAMSQWYEDLILEEQVIQSSGSERTVNVNLSNMTGAGRQRIIDWHRDANPNLNWDDERYKAYGTSTNTDGSWKGLEVPVGVMLDLGFDPRYFTGGSAVIRDAATAILHGDVGDGDKSFAILSEEDLLALSSHENAVDENYGRRKAAFDMAYLDIDPEDIEAKVTGPVSFVERIIDEGTIAVKTQWLDYSEREARESTGAYSGAGRRRTLDALQSAAIDFNADNKEAIEKGEMTQLNWTEDQAESFERNLGENVAVGVGEFVPTLVELAAITVATNGVLTASRAGVYLTRLKSSGIWGKLQYHMAQLAIEEAKMKVAGFKTGSGAAFYAGGAATPWFRPSFLSKRLKGFDAIWNKTVKAGVVGAASGELAGVTELAIESAMGEKDFDFHLNELYGDMDEVEQRVITNALVFSVAGNMGKHRLKAQDFYITAPAKLRLRNNLSDKIDAAMRKPEVQREFVELTKERDKLVKDYKDGNISEAKYEMEKTLLDFNINEIKSNKSNYMELKDLNPIQKRRVKDLSETLQSVNHLFAAQTRDKALTVKNPDGTPNKNFEANYKKIILDPINAVLQRANPGQKPVTVRFVEGKEARRVMEEGNLAEFDPATNELIFDKSQYTSGKSNHELIHMALRQVFKGKSGNRLEVKFKERLDQVFEEAYGKGLKDMMSDFYGEGGLSAAVFKGYKAEQRKGESLQDFQRREMELRQEEYLANLAEFISNPEVYYSQVNNTFMKNAKAEFKSFMEETLPGIDKMFSRDMTKDMSAKDFIDLLGRMGSDASRGIGIKGKIKKLANLQDVSFLGIEYVDATKPEVMASRDLRAERDALKNENLDLVKNKPEGYLEKAKANTVKIQDLTKNIEAAEKNVELMKEYDILESEANLENATEVDRLKMSRKFEQIRNNNEGILENYINKTYKDIPGSNLTRDMFKDYVYNTEFLKLFNTYRNRGEANKGVEFGAYLQLPNTLQLRTGNILKGLGVDMARTTSTTSIEALKEAGRDIAAEPAAEPMSQPSVKTEGIDLVFKLDVPQNTVDVISSKVESLDIANLNYNTLKDLVPASTKAMFGKSTQAKANFIANNWKTLYDLLPKNVSETTGTATGVENSLMTRKKPGVGTQDVFYESTGKTVKFAETGAKTGTEIKNVRKLNKTEFLAELGIKDNRTTQDLNSGEGNVDISGMNVKVDRGITTSVLPSLINQTGKAISNQVVRSKIREIAKTKPELLESVEKDNIETLLNDIASGKSDKLAAKDIAKEYRRNGLNKKLDGIFSDVNRFMRDMPGFQKSNPKEYELIKDVIEDYATVEAEIGKQNEIAFTKETVKLEGDWAENGSWRTSEAKFKNDATLVKEFADNNFEIAELINLPENAISGNMKMVLDMFTGHYSVLRGVTTFDKVGSPFKTGLKKRMSDGKSTLPKELQDRLANINYKALKSSYNGTYKTAYNKINQAGGNTAKQKEIARENFKGEIAEAQLEFYDVFNSVLQHWVHSSPKGSADFNRKMNHVARMKKHNSSIGTSGERVLAPVGYVYLPGKVIEGTVKYEHLKSSSQQSYESLALIAENRWSSEGRKSLQNYEGIYGFLHDFNVIDKATGKVNSSGIFRLAETMELAKDIYSTKSNFEKSLYQEMVEQVGEKKIKEMLKNEKQLDTQHEKSLASSKLGSKELNKSERLELMKDVSRAMANARLVNPKRKGMSTWDFDDTLAKTKSDVLFTAPDGTKGKLNATEFAKRGAELLSEGYKFDFSEFNKVTDGKPGPFLEKALERAKKFGTKDQFILTARAPEAAPAIKEFLDAQGFNLPLENIVGLGNSTGAAKARWMLKKFGQGYNDMYFADDAMANVDAVKFVLDKLDIKSDVQQARKLASVDISREFNEMIERKTGIGAEKVFSGAKGKMLGKRRKPQSIVVPGAQDFMGLMQNFMGKGSKGNADRAFFENNLVKPFARATKEMNESRQRSSEDLKKLYKELPSVRKKLNKNLPNSAFTYDQAIRSYLWEKAGFEVPELSARDLKEMTDAVKNDRNLLIFADGLNAIGKGTWTKPTGSWVGETIVSDLFRLNSKERRSEYLQEWQEKIDIIFSKENLNKIEATQGSKYREALEDSIYRMKTGSNRPTGANRLTNQFNNWINGSVGATMFLNMRSAMLQTISATNYVNWSFNNPVKAAGAFGNQKQYWSDFSMLWNSPMLKQRRAGLEYNVQEAELAAAMAGQKNKAKAAVAWLIKKGFTPTQVADSFAICGGGATYYRNKFKELVKQGMSPVEAKEKAFLDFQELTETNQQSSRADLISQQQASGLGRTILAWSNTPMQYMRIQEKAARDIVNGRGDLKSNMSKIAYYGVIQGTIFAALQNALFSWGLDEEEDLDDESLNKAIDRSVNTVIDSQLRGLGVIGAATSAIRNTVLEFEKQEEKAYDENYLSSPDHSRTVLQLTSFSPVISSKLRKLYSAGNEWNYNRGAIQEMGFDIDNPAIHAGANVIEATTNLPVARFVQKIDNLQGALDDSNQNWQRISLLMGYPKWQLGIVDTEVEEAAARGQEKIKEIQKEAERQAKEAKEQTYIQDQKQEKQDGKETTCAGAKSSGERCTNKPLPGEKFCTIHQKVEQREDDKEIQCLHMKPGGVRCKMKTKNKSGKCYYHD